MFTGARWGLAVGAGGEVEAGWILARRARGGEFTTGEALALHPAALEHPERAGCASPLCSQAGTLMHSGSGVPRVRCQGKPEPPALGSSLRPRPRPLLSIFWE